MVLSAGVIARHFAADEKIASDRRIAADGRHGSRLRTATPRRISSFERDIATIFM
jgi:hypothetical protein